MTTLPTRQQPRSRQSPITDPVPKTASEYELPVRSYEHRVVVINHAATGGAAMTAIEDKGLSIRGVAKAMGISASYLSDLTKGRRHWTQAKADLFSRAVRKLEDEMTAP